MSRQPADYVAVEVHVFSPTATPLEVRDRIERLITWEAPAEVRVEVVEHSGKCDREMCGSDWDDIDH
jgi:hypothetical protein